jgi:hypothetical protein
VKGLILILGLTFLVACDDSSKPEQSTITRESVGPFSLSLSQGNTDIENEFDVPINQSEGAVEFLLPPQQKIYWMKFEYSMVTAAGCDNRNVVAREYWTNDPSQVPREITDGKHFSSRPNQEGKIVVALTGLQGCTSVAYKLKVSLISADDAQVFGASAVTCFGSPYGHKLDIFQGSRDLTGVISGYLMHGFPSQNSLTGPYNLSGEMATTDVRRFFETKPTTQDLVFVTGPNKEDRLLITFLRNPYSPELFLGGGRYVSLNCIVN